MNWYLSKIIYQIISDQGKHTPQFDEQLRLIAADDELHAFQKARLLGESEEDNFLNSNNKIVSWKFIDVPEIHKLNNLVDGVEMYSKIREEDDAQIFIKTTRLRAKHLFENFVAENIPSS